MVTHISHQYTHQEALDSLLYSSSFSDAVSASSAILVQIYSADTNPEHLQAITELIAARLPDAAIVGATTVGEIIAGQSITGSTVIGITCFESSSVSVIAMSCQDRDAQLVGAELGMRICQYSDKIAGILLLATPLSIDASLLLQGIESTAAGYPIFGGGAGDYAAMKHTLVMAGSEQYAAGAVAVILAGDDLHIVSSTYLGWRPLSKSMRVTKVNQLLVETVDDMPAFDVYQRYLNIQNDDNFFLNALEFPFIVERDGEQLARVPIAATREGAVQFVADIKEGERFRIGYGDMDLIVNDALSIHRSIKDFSPQAIFLYTCGCRRFLMQKGIDLETLPFETIAPTIGFYTYGEFISSTNLQLLNSTMVAVGLREGPALSVPETHHGSSADTLAVQHESDPYADQHVRVVSRLLRFIDAVTTELEESNREITKLSRTDRLTQLDNRIQLDRVLEENLQRALRYNTSFAIIMLDLDHFKQVNDMHGHLAGDDILIHTAKILLSHTRNVDTVGRWGGEEFLIIAPNSTLNDAALLAEKLRVAIEAHSFPFVDCKTASFGATGFVPGDDVVKMINRADVALYHAKHSGRNRVEIACAG